ncbi:hypothetical protein [Streptomyces sp. NPDC057301]|uniref:hypothetical protein n=1 Tax=Streptomyces sp. NPDC057301 TaxID=3346093 RepID=UPI0036361F63
MTQQTFTEQAGVAYAIVGRGKRVHYSPRNDDTLCGRAITEYLDLEQAVALFDEGRELCTTCHKAAEQRAEARRLAEASPLAAAAVALAETVEQVDAEQAVEPRYVVEDCGDDQYGVWDGHTIEWAVEQTTLEHATQTAARLNREYAEARAAGPMAHLFHSTGEAYDATQGRAHILDGDVLVIEREQVVGFLRSAWPGAITTAHGELATFTRDPRLIDNGKYAATVALAEQVARFHGFPLTEYGSAPAASKQQTEGEVAEAEPADAVEAVEQAEAADGTWRGGWISGEDESATPEALFDVDQGEGDQGALFA